MRVDAGKNRGATFFGQESATNFRVGFQIGTRNIFVRNFNADLITLLMQQDKTAGDSTGGSFPGMHVKIALRSMSPPSNHKKKTLLAPRPARFG